MTVMRTTWMERAERATCEQECERMIAAYEADRMAIFLALESQFHTLQNRAQVILGICGVLLTASVLLMTGKLIVAGRDVANVVLASRMLIVAGTLDVLAGAVAVAGVLRIRWVTPPRTDLRDWLAMRLQQRERKTRALHVSITLLVTSMIIYQIAAALVLVQL